jgi:hypothetical protein
LKFTIRICTATSLVRARGPQDDYEVPPGYADEDLMRIELLCSSDELLREFRDLVEVLLDVGQGLAAVAVGLLTCPCLRSEVARSRYL